MLSIPAPREVREIDFRENQHSCPTSISAAGIIDAPETGCLSGGMCEVGDGRVGPRVLRAETPVTWNVKCDQQPSVNMTHRDSRATY
jgi:hypothetical protein